MITPKGKPGLMVAVGMPKNPPADGQDTEGQGDPNDTSSGEDCIPLSALAMPDPDNGDQMANPDIGDRVNYQVEGTVTRIEGDNAYVKRESVNGQPVDGGSDDDQGGGGQSQDDQDAQDRQELGGLADQMGGMP